MLRAAWELVGWETLSPDQQSAAIYGGVIGFGSAMATYALFGYRYLRRQWRSRTRRKTRTRRRR
jgi:hypothetical protein